MKIAFCGHSYHRVTNSTAFLRDLLREHGEVSEFWDESWLVGKAMPIEPVLAGGFDAVVVFQMELLALALAKRRLRNVTFFPMYDGCYGLPDSYWRLLSGIKIVNFSSALHERLQRLGARCRFVRYWPDPAGIAPVERSAGLAGYFWQRQQDLTWEHVRRLLGDQRFERFTLHKALDPSYGDFVTPSDEDVARYGIRITEWFGSRAEATADLRRHNVYFAPRLREGIGMSFLEAMAMGFLVVAPNQPTMSEYIVSGVNGLLYDTDALAPLNLAGHAALGAAARRCVEQGWRKWARSRAGLMRYVLTPTAEVAPQAPLDAFDPLAIENRPAPPPARARAEAAPPADALQGGRRSREPAQDGASAPLVTVAIVTRNAAGSLAKTLESIVCQDWSDRELIVLDGVSQDGTLDVLRAYDDAIDFWRSAPDGGPFDAMNAAAREARGRYIIFMNAGDWFQSTDALSNALEGLAGEPDLIYGHHVYRDVHGRDVIHLARDFAQTWAQLRSGDVDWRWLSGVPGHQATLTRTQLLREMAYRTDLRITADHEFLYRLAVRSGRFHHTGTLLSTYVSGGLSWRNQERCFEEWRGIAMQYTAHPERVRFSFDWMRAEMEASALRRQDWPHRLLRLLRGRYALRVLAWRAWQRLLRMRRAWRARTRTVRVDFGVANLGRYVERYQGLSTTEGWGRWSIGERVRIDFRDPVRNPYRFSIHIRKVFGPNVGQALVVKVGGATYHFGLGNGEQRFSAVLDNRPGAIPRVELVIPQATSPLELGEGRDTRRLGIALVAIELQLRGA